jgi:hypothetical protein
MSCPNDPSGQTIWAGSVSGGLWKTTNIDGVPAVEPPAGGNDFEIDVFPNPVLDGTTNISLSLPESGTVSVFIYDDLGRLIHTIWKDQKVMAGTYQPVATVGFLMAFTSYAWLRK